MSRSSRWPIRSPSRALAIHTEAGTVLHTGDWKIDPTPIIGLPTDERRLRELGDEGVLVLVGDSTNAVREGRSPSETEVAKTLSELVEAAQGPSCGHHLCVERRPHQGCGRCGQAVDREVVAVGRAMERVTRSRVKPATSTGCRTSAAWSVRPFAPGQGACALHRQPGRAARGACPDCQRRPSRGHAEPGRPRDLLLAHDPGQREGGWHHHQRADRAGRRGHHRSHASRPCFRPSAPRRTARHDRWIRPQSLSPVHGEALHLQSMRSSRGRRRAAGLWSAAMAI